MKVFRRLPADGARRHLFADAGRKGGRRVLRGGIQYQLFYFSEEEKVYPSTDASVYKKYTGMPVGEFERVIRKHWSGRAA